MAANDDNSELNIQDRTQTAASAEQPTAIDHDIHMVNNEHVQAGDVAEQLAVEELSAITTPAVEDSQQETFAPPAAVPNQGSGEMSSTNGNNETEMRGAATSVMSTDCDDNTATEHHGADLESNNPDALQVSSPSVAETAIASNHGQNQSAPALQGPQTDSTVQDELDNEMASDSETEEADQPVQRQRRRRVRDEEQESESDNVEYSDDGSRASEEEEADEDDEEDMAELQSRLKRSVARRQPQPGTQPTSSNWNMRQDLFEEDTDVQEVPRQEFDRNFQSQPHLKQQPSFEGYGGPHQAQQPPLHAYNPRAMDPFSAGMYGGHQSSPFMSAPQPGMHQKRPMTSHGYQNPAHMPAASAQTNPFSSAFPYHGPQGQHAIGFQDPRYQPYGQAPYQPGYNPSPMSAYETHGQAFLPPSQAHFQPLARGVATVRNNQQRGLAKKYVSEKDSGSSEDDEPLRTRVPRKPSKVSDAGEDSSTPAPKTTKRGKQQKQDCDSDIEVMEAKVKAEPTLGFKNTKAAKTASKKSTPAQPAQSQPAQPANSESIDQDPTSQPTIDWKLPRYEAKFEPPKTKDDPTVAKISLPNLVREELLLSPDHAEQESHLILHVFLPMHQALAQPDPLPATAALNFHTIALMVIEAFVQFEIGDEYGTGRGHWHNAHDQSDVDYLRQRSAKDADPDEIFFAVIDRWRAGTESRKENAKMIRGVQEFCDIALDVIYYIKEHGLLKERQNAWEKKGNKGARKVEYYDEDDDGKVKGGKKRTGAVKELTPRKKPKTAAKSKSTVTVTRKKTPKKSVGGVTVMRRKG